MLFVFFFQQRSCFVFSILLDTVFGCGIFNAMAKAKGQELVHINVAIRSEIATRLKARAEKAGWSLKVAVERLLDESLDRRDADDRAMKELAKAQGA